MKLRKAAFKDWEILLDWRNDPLTRKNSFSQEIIDENSHKNWFRQTLSSSKSIIYILENKYAEPVGNIRADKIKKNTYVLSWSVSPLHRKKGYGNLMLNLYLKNRYGTFIAKIKPQNVASIRMVQKNYFKKISKNTYTKKSLKILYLGPKNNRVYNFISDHHPCTDSTEKKIHPSFIKEYDWVISYGYRHILKKEHIQSSNNPIINLHISYLPWNRGADPNYWSWVENTPKGVTIHAIDEGIDTGDIFIQKEIIFHGDETLSSSYNKLKNEIEDLFINNFENIIEGRILPQKQQKGGSLHYMKDFPGERSWDLKVKNIIK